MDPVLTTIVAAILAAIPVMWKQLRSEQARLARRNDECEEDRKVIHGKLEQHGQILAVFKACPATPCPAREGLDRAGSFPGSPVNEPKNRILP